LVGGVLNNWPDLLILILSFCLFGSESIGTVCHDNEDYKEYKSEYTT